MKPQTSNNHYIKITIMSFNTDTSTSSNISTSSNDSTYYHPTPSIASTSFTNKSFQLNEQIYEIIDCNNIKEELDSYRKIQMYTGKANKKVNIENKRFSLLMKKILKQVYSQDKQILELNKPHFNTYIVTMLKNRRILDNEFAKEIASQNPNLTYTPLTQINEPYINLDDKILSDIQEHDFMIQRYIDLFNETLNQILNLLTPFNQHFFDQLQPLTLKCLYKKLQNFTPDNQIRFQLNLNTSIKNIDNQIKEKISEYENLKSLGYKTMITNLEEIIDNNEDKLSENLDTHYDNFINQPSLTFNNLNRPRQTSTLPTPRSNETTFNLKLPIQNIPPPKENPYSSSPSLQSYTPSLSNAGITNITCSTLNIYNTPPPPNFQHDINQNKIPF